MDAKNELQELLQKCHLDAPTYKEEDSSGPSHSPLFVCSAMVTWNHESLEEKGEGRRKKDAEKNAAKKMLQRLKDMEARARDISTGKGGAKNDLHALLERDHLPAPVHTPLCPKGPAHQLRTVKLEIQDEGQQQKLWVGHGEGKSKAEGSATQDALQYMEHAKPKAGPLHPPSLQLEESSDVEVTALLSRFNPSYEFDEAGDGVWLCMAFTSRVQHPVAAHGQGDCKTAAKRVASFNLIHNIHHLFPQAFSHHDSY